MVILSDKIKTNYRKKLPPKRGEDNLPWCCGNGERVIPIYGGRYLVLMLSEVVPLIHPFHRYHNSGQRIKGAKEYANIIWCRIEGARYPAEHRWELTVLRYHIIRVNYPGVNFQVIFHDFITKQYHKNQSNGYPFPLIIVSYSVFSLNYHILCFQAKIKIFSFLKKYSNNFYKNG